MKLSLAGGALLALTLAASAHGGASPTGTVSSSRLVEGGNIKITATIRTPTQPGKSLRGRFTVKNVSTEPQTIELDNAEWLVMHASHGTTYDTRIARGLLHIHGRPPRPVTLQPGQAVRSGLPYLPVLWTGPLRVVPGWDGSRLPALWVSVSWPRPPIDDYTAIADVVAKTGHLIDNCRPVSSGVAVTGWIYAPNNDAPPMRVRCSISLRHERGFDDAQVLIFSPRKYHGVHFYRRYERFSPAQGRNAEAIGWDFIVTRRGARSVRSATVYTTPVSHRFLRVWTWTPSGPGEADHYRCGGGGFVISSEGPEVDFVSNCGRR